MVTISLCMIVKDEEKTLARCLKSVKDAVDEIVIVDTGSKDNTPLIAKEYTDKVYFFKWTDDFSEARNYAFSFATKDYVMWLDADDVITPENLVKLKKLKETLKVTTVYARYDIAFNESGAPTFSYLRERIFRKKDNPVWVDPIHETVKITGDYIISDFTVEHRKERENPKGRNLKIFYNQIKKGVELSPRMKYYFARELMYNGKTKRAIKTFKDFLQSDKGFIEDRIEASYNLSTCYESLDDNEMAMSALFNAFKFSPPRPEGACRIGAIFFNTGDYDNAKFWYEYALKIKNPENLFGFNKNDYSGFIPAIQLCVIYDRKGDRKRAKLFNELAGSFNPKHPAYLKNKEYFEKS